MARPRKFDVLRATSITAGPAAAGAVIITQGRTQVLCTASLAREVPGFLIDKATGEPRQGWVTAEYNMMPGSTPQRKKRGPDSRGTEIQRLIGRSLRAAVDLEKMPGITVALDCDVLVADGGTRTASITGAYVALAQALGAARKQGWIDKDPLTAQVAAISVGVVDNQPRLDLDYELDVKAQVDMNVVMNHHGQFIEIQGTGEHGTFSRAECDTLLDLAGKGIRKLIAVQKRALAAIKQAG